MPNTAKEIRAKALNRAEKEFQNIEKVIDILEELDSMDSSYLKEELGKYTDAMHKILYAGISKFSDNDIDNACATLSGFSDFLAAGEGKTNYQRILDDYNRLENKPLDVDIFRGAMNSINKITGLEISLNKAEGAELNMVFDPKIHKEVRPVKTQKVTTADQLEEVAKQGKNFLDPDSKEYKAVKKLSEDLEKVSRKAKEDTKTWTVANSYRAMINLFQTGKPGVEQNVISKQLSFSEADYQKKHNKALLLDKFGKTESLFNFILPKKKDTVFKEMVNLGLNPTVFANGIKAMDKVFNYGIKVDHILRSKDETLVKADALTHIENMQKYEQPNDTYGDKVQWYVARIMTTRKMVDSVLGKKASLKGKTITNFEIDDETKKMMENKQFKMFLNYVSLPENRKATLDAAKFGNGHGGRLDKMYTNFLKMLPAGELKNDPENKRYMPTVIDRIEALQKQAEKKYNGGRGDLPAKEIAEVIALRESIGVGHNQKSRLKVPIPADGKLQERVQTILNDPRFTAALTPENIGKLQRGHGGEMQNDIAVAKRQLEIAQANPQANPQAKRPMGMG